MKNIRIGYQGDPEAHEYFLKGEYLLWNRFIPIRDNRDFNHAEEMFKKAIKLDSTFSDAYAGLANLYEHLGDQLPEYKLKRDSVLKLGKKVSPNSAYLFYAHGFRYMDERNIDSALYFFMTAHNIEPDNQAFTIAIIDFLSRIGLDQIEPLLIWSYKELIAISIMVDNNLIEAHRLYEIAQNISSNIGLKNEKSLILAAEGKREQALRTTKSLDVYSKSLDVYSVLDMKKEALNLIDSSSSATNFSGGYNSFSYNFLTNAKQTEFIRDEPRFQEILAKAKIVHEEHVAKYGHLFDEE